MELEQDTLLQAAEQRLRHLSLDRLRVALDFLTYLEQKEEDEATEELLNISGLTTEFHAAMQEAAVGEVIPFSQIRRNG
ncbi:MAG: hypothetical protein LH647_20285 [Leptolyngbyaceae cyanobacterium CAN_BIN12]|nr:hypothetical protein [Leptolyngbyaceae cyanobacterium CAN_BIN12]